MTGTAPTRAPEVDARALDTHEPSNRVFTAQLTRWRRASQARLGIYAARLLVLAAVLLLWQFVPQIGDLSSRANLLDPFFISSPELIFNRLVDLTTGRNDTGTIWSFVWPTFGAAVAGAAIGLLLGGLLGLILSAFSVLSDVLRPFVVALNAVPRIALIPIIVVLLGTGLASSVVIGVMVVFFIGVFNAYEGGRTIEPHVLHHARIHGASKWDIMRTIRYPYALAWTLASLPIAVTFSIISVVTGEILTGYAGLGRLIVDAQTRADATLTFAVVTILSILALAVLGVAEWFKRRVLHWWIQTGDP